ncbi:Patellin-5 [Thalictrum thalictroides]|uniref:Patellin-5 n=1 Tax=Thalictrum thalictroides TaxID=46969 RepID=A0A7J6W8J6_THATH|nr:Patellin-5 [Thalictrum thalictroides]
MDTSRTEMNNDDEVKKEEISLETNQHKLCLMRSFVEKQDPNSKEVDDHILNRFLRYRKLDVDKASYSFLNYLKWRQAVAPKGSISESEILNELSQNKLFLQGFDKKRRPIAVSFYGRHVPINGTKSLDELKRFWVYSLDKVCARMHNGQEQFSFIGDFKGWGFSNCDVKCCQEVLSILQDYYPEMLGQIYLINMPSIFRAIWKIIVPFIRKNTRKKLVFVEGKKVKSRLLEDIDEDQLAEIYGGKLALVPIEDS